MKTHNLPRIGHKTARLGGDITAMDTNHAPQIKAPQLRKWRAQPWVWRIIFLTFAGPLNVAGWVLGRPQEGNFILTDMTVFAFIILVPATIVSLFMQYRMRRKVVFTATDLFVWAAVGLLIACLSGPIMFVLAGVATSQITLGEGLQMLPVIMFFGVLVGIVPYFAIYIGAPCAIVAFAAAYLCSEPSTVPPEPVDPISR